MPSLGQIMTHLRLVLRMGQLTGVDIAAAHQNGHLSQQDWADMVQRCRGCAWARSCSDWLDRRDSVAAVPNTCPNRAQFTALKNRQLQEH